MLLDISLVIGDLLFIAVVLFVGRLTFLDREPHHGNWLSFAGGVAVAYCFSYLLPKLAAKQAYLDDAEYGGLMGFLDNHVYLVATAGLVAYFGLNRAADYMSSLTPEKKKLRRLRHVFAHADITGASAYFMLIGYLLSELNFLTSLILFVCGLGLHVLGLAHIFRDRYPLGYDARIRWYFAGSFLAGGILGWTTEVSELVVGVLTAFMAGAVIATAFREELPTESKLRFWPFFAGVTILLVASFLVEWFEKGGG